MYVSNHNPYKFVSKKDFFMTMPLQQVRVITRFEIRIIKKSKYLLCFFNFNRVSLFIVLVSGTITSKYSHTRFSLCFVSEANMITDTVHFYSHLGVSSSHTTLSLYAYTAYPATFTPLQASVSYVLTCLSSRNTRWTCF